MAFRLINKNLDFSSITLYPKVERKLPTAKDKGWTKVGGFLLRENIDFMPQPGLQENVCQCEANIIYMCGAATGGKTFAGIMMQLYRVDKKGSSGAMISTRLQDSKKGGSIFRDNELVLGAFGGCEYNTSDYPTFAWKQWGSVYRLIHSNFNTDNPQERAAFIEYAKKNQNGYQYFDEANDLPEFQYFYWNSRNRDASGCTPQSVYSFNPPGPDSYFTKNLVNGGYVDPRTWLFKPEMNGVVRYYYALGDSVDDYVWGETPQEVCEAAGVEISEKDRDAGLTEADMVKSFAAFISDAAENRILISATKGGSVANLHAVGKTQRAVLRGAYFGPIDNEEINVNRDMIHRLWENPVDGDENMYATMDISLGKKDSDQCPIFIWKGLQVIALHHYKNDEPIINFIERILTRYNVPITHFAYDATGVGGLLEQFLKKGAIGITANRRVIQEYDTFGNAVQVDEYFNLRSQLLGKLELHLKKGEISFAIPKDTIVPFGHKGETRRLMDILCDEMNVFTTLRRNKKIYYRSKDEYKSKFKSSPDRMDALSYREIFELDTRERKQPKQVVTDDAYDELYRRPPRHLAFGRRIYR